MTSRIRSRSSSLCALLLCAALCTPAASRAASGSERGEVNGIVTAAKYTGCALGIATASNPLSFGAALLNCARLMHEALT